MDFQSSPPENAVRIYHRIADLGGCNDPFATLKKESNRAAMRLRPRLEKIIGAASDPVATTVKLTLAGNIIDYGSQQSFDVEQAILACLANEPWGDDLPRFLEDLTQADRILYLADNCGELVFDGLLIERLAAMGKEVCLAVKEKPIINDALATDATECGIDQYCTVISNGTGCPGTPLDRCSRTFRQTFSNADLIISKGQGNFETLAGTPGPIYYLLTVKCGVVAEHIGHQGGRPAAGKEQPALGSMVLLKNRTSQGA